MTTDRLHTTKELEVSNLTDVFALKNYVLSDTGEMPDEFSLTDPFIFDGVVFSVCLKGSAVIKINFEQYEISERILLTIMPNQIFQVEEHSEDFLIETLFLSSDFIPELNLPKDFDLLKKIVRDPRLEIPKETMHDILELHALITKYHKQEDRHYRERIIRALTYTLLLVLASEYKLNIPDTPIRPPSRQEELTREFFELLLEHFNSERSVAFYADKMCLTPKYLSTAIKKVTGESILHWISLAVIIQAKKLLKTTDHTMLEISEELNFPNPSFFGRFFKQYTGMTPLKYRNQTTRQV